MNKGCYVRIISRSIRKLRLFVILFFIVYSLQLAYADNGETQNQQSFPFDQPCLKFDKANFKVGPALLDIMKEGDFPQYCVLYSLSNYQVKQKNEEGYSITGLKSEIHNPEASMVILKSDKLYKPNQSLMGKDSGQWAYFVGPEEFTQENGTEKEVYVFQEIDLR